MISKLYEKSSLKNIEYKIDKNYLYNAECMIHKKAMEKLEISKEKTYKNVNSYR